jgi:zinc/manganese transport system substrate-binding protein
MRSMKLLIAALLAAPAPAFAATTDAALHVVATVPDLAAIARAIGGELVDVQTMSLATQDPHFVDARPHLALALSRADLLLVNGLDLEIGWLPTLVNGSRNPRVRSGSPGYLDCSKLIDPLEVVTGRVDRAHGDIHPGGNPHYLIDPRAVLKVVAGIAARMAELDPEHAERYKKGGADFARELESARARWEQKLASLRGTKAVGYHKSWAYLADWLGLNMIEHIEPKPGIPPTPAHVATVLQKMRQESVKLVLQEEYYPATTATLVAEKSGAHLVLVPGGADFAHGETYLAKMERLVEMLSGEKKR